MPTSETNGCSSLIRQRRAEKRTKDHDGCMQGARASDGFLAIADIDNFKKINDRYGHNAGDAVLKTVAERMQQSCAGCLVARWGGEEFLIVSEKPFAEGIALLDAMRQEIAGAV